MPIPNLASEKSQEFLEKLTNVLGSTLLGGYLGGPPGAIATGGMTAANVFSPTFNKEIGEPLNYVPQLGVLPFIKRSPKSKELLNKVIQNIDLANTPVVRYQQEPVDLNISVTQQTQPDKETKGEDELLKVRLESEKQKQEILKQLKKNLGDEENDDK